MDYDMRGGLAVKDLFDIPHFREAILLGGEAGLEKTISRVNVMEVPDVADWVRPGEFLMTTGYPFKDDPDTLVTLIAELAQKGVVALGLKTKRFVDAVPEAAVRAADRCGMPLIELPPGTAFSDVVREVMERVLVSESKELTVLQGRVQRLSRMLLHGDGLPAFMNHLQLMIHHPVVLLDPENRLVASPDAERYCRLIDDAGWHALRSARDREASVLQVAGSSVRVRVMPVSADPLHPYLLLVFEEGGGYGIVDSLTVNWAGRLLGFEISNMQARKKIEMKYFDQFLQDWMTGRIVSSVDLRLRAEACGWPLERHASYIAGAAALEDGPNDAKEQQELAKRLNGESVLRGCGGIKWTVLEGGLVVLLTFRGNDREEEEGAVQAAWSILQSVLRGKRAALCLGRTADGTDGVPDSYRDAKRVAEIRRVCRLGNNIVRYRELGVYMLLYRLQGSEELAEFSRMYVAPLLEMDRKQQGSLLTTLRTYIHCNCNAKETAERMFVHYNTISYRLERIRNELGLRLDDPETKLLVQLALKAIDIGESE
ncbi:PucR family transcriptional regulator ligand-binding domain-containing protein [Paenibacillus cisolokensis]|uniref:PucR family transcriptional regulator n=1 Tax=Paenibacillus cisolokensis TaxID=1658519 RepID=UPI003D2C15B4